jgi:hypothetical protein
MLRGGAAFLQKRGEEDAKDRIGALFRLEILHSILHKLGLEALMSG